MSFFGEQQKKSNTPITCILHYPNPNSMLAQKTDKQFATANDALLAQDATRWQSARLSPS
jgi:hypothetical protein